MIGYCNSCTEYSYMLDDSYACGLCSSEDTVYGDHCHDVVTCNNCSQVVLVSTVSNTCPNCDFTGGLMDPEV